MGINDTVSVNVVVLKKKKKYPQKVHKIKNKQFLQPNRSNSVKSVDCNSQIVFLYYSTRVTT